MGDNHHLIGSCGQGECHFTKALVTIDLILHDLSLTILIDGIADALTQLANGCRAGSFG